MPEGYHITEYSDLTLGRCDGRVTPSACSGLTIVSRLPISETQFYHYEDCGNIDSIVHDFECAGGKGVGRIRLVRWGQNLEGLNTRRKITIDVFVTHMIADKPETGMRLTDMMNAWICSSYIWPIDIDDCMDIFSLPEWVRCCDNYGLLSIKKVTFLKTFFNRFYPKKD